MKHFIEQIARLLFLKHFKHIEMLGIAVLLFAVYGNHLVAVEFQPDETFWIVSSRRFDAFLQADFDSPIWVEKPLISFEVRPIPSYLVAIGQRLGGISPEGLPIYWDWSLPEATNIAYGAMPSAPVLFFSRLPMALISIFSLLGMIYLLAIAHSRLAGYLFALVSINDYFLLHLRRAMSEAPLILFTVLTLYTAYKLLIAIHESSKNRIIFWSVLAGIFSGMAGQSKLTGLACSAITVLGALIFVLATGEFSLSYKKWLLLTITCFTVSTSFLVFYISYPFFYENTLHRILTTFYVRGQVVQSQLKTYPEQTISSNERVGILFQRIFKYPLSLEAFTSIQPVFNALNFLIAFGGLYYAVRQIWKRTADQKFFIVLLMGTIICAVPMLLTPLDWDRYYLYPIFFSCVFFAVGFSQFVWIAFSTFERQTDVPLTARS